MQRLAVLLVAVQYFAAEQVNLQQNAYTEVIARSPAGQSHGYPNSIAEPQGVLGMLDLINHYVFIVK
jgi:hypothetical protein